MKLQHQVSKQLMICPDDYSHKIEVNSDANLTQTCLIGKFEQSLQDRKRSIKLLNPTYLTTFVQEFNNLVRGPNTDN